MNTLECDSPGTLAVETLKLVKAEPRGLLEVAQKTGVPYHWLRKYAAGKIPNPSVNRVEFLFKKLSAKKLPL